MKGEVNLFQHDVGRFDSLKLVKQQLDLYGLVELKKVKKVIKLSGPLMLSHNISELHA